MGKNYKEVIMKKKYFFIIFLLIIILSYVTNISQIPERIILLEGEKLEFKKLYGIEIKPKDILQTWQSGNAENEEWQVSILGKVNVKEVSVTTLPSVKVVPVGNLIGLKLYTNGVLVIGMTEIKNINNEIEKPYENINIQEGDTILEINNKEIDSIKTLQSIVNSSSGNNIEMKYAHNRRNINFKYKTNSSK